MGASLERGAWDRTCTAHAGLSPLQLVHPLGLPPASSSATSSLDGSRAAGPLVILTHTRVETGALQMGVTIILAAILATSARIVFDGLMQVTTARPVVVGAAPATGRGAGVTDPRMLAVYRVVTCRRCTLPDSRRLPEA